MESTTPRLKQTCASRRRPGRVAACLTLALVLGAATCIAVAWALALRPLQTGFVQESWNTYRDGGIWSVHRFRGNGVSWTSWLLMVAEDDPLVSADSFGLIVEQSVRDYRLTSSPGHTLEGVPPGSSPPRLAGPRMMMPREGWSEEARGWPALALWCKETIPDAQWSGGIPIASAAVWPRLPVLPVRPIWSGLILNTLLYAALWTVMFSTPRLVRQYRRRRRGACLTCGYARTGLPSIAQCPECGSPAGVDGCSVTCAGPGSSPRPAASAENGTQL
jgi:hypothetical protein